MVTLLCMGDKTHSNLTELMPEKCGQTGQSKDFEPTLKQVLFYFLSIFDRIKRGLMNFPFFGSSIHSYPGLNSVIYTVYLSFQNVLFCQFGKKHMDIEYVMVHSRTCLTTQYQVFTMSS